MCGRALEEDEGEYKCDQIVCPTCDPSKKSSGKAPNEKAGAENVDDEDIGKEQGGGDDEQVTKEQGASAAEKSGGQKWKQWQPPAMTSQKGTKASSKGPKIGVKKRVKIQCSSLFLILSTDKQRGSILKSTPNNHWFFGTVTDNGRLLKCPIQHSVP